MQLQSACVCVCVYICIYVHVSIQNPRASTVQNIVKSFKLAPEGLGSPRTTMLQLKLLPRRSKLVQAYLHGTLPELINLTSLHITLARIFQFQLWTQLSCNYFKYCCIMLHCAMQTSLQNTGAYSSPPWDCSFKL